MSGNGSILWLMFSILQAFLAFSGVIPSEMAILQTVLGGNSLAFLAIYLYFMFKNKPKGFLDSKYDKDERSIRVKDENGVNQEVGQKPEGSRWEKWASMLWFLSLIIGFQTLI
ncbi:MAG: hypothetical protein CMB56_002110 [Methanobacteriota archaeon]|nr:MAG: hypothetical protein CMB56_002110 [Euryarchaeota archaeon]|tara:strand:- start:732 stop:1070 length:339 start_codon:yes stop_codon:yes gene_type:complete